MQKWLKLEAASLHSISLGQGLLLLVRLASKTGGEAIAIQLSPTEVVEFSRKPGPLLAEAQSHWPKENRFAFRLLGPAALIKTFSTSLSAAGLLAMPHGVLEGPAELQFIPAEGRVRVEKKAGPVKKIRVLIIDDSESVCKLLKRIVDQDPTMEAVGAVTRPSLAAQAIEKTRPDVLTMDIHMPEMDGVQLLRTLMPRFRIPVIMISSLRREEGSAVLDALEAGAVDYIEKPTMDKLAETSLQIQDKIRMASVVRMGRTPVVSAPVGIRPTGSLDLNHLIVIGSSTGGTEALKVVLTGLPAEIPPILIVQHIPAVFSAAFAERMNQLCPFNVKEAVDGDEALPNQVLVAPGGKQMKLVQKANALRVVIDDSPPMNRHKPSVDFLFESVAALKLPKLIACILTGMGADGARGLLALRQAGARTFAQDEATSVVYGMPREALKNGGAEEAVPLERISEKLMDLAAQRAPGLKRARQSTG